MLMVGVVNKDPARLPALSRRLRGAVIVPMQDAPQAIVFPEPTDAIDSALEAGKHVSVCATDQLSRTMLTRWTDLAQQRGVHLSVINPDRYLPSLQLIRQQLDAGKLGEPGLIRIHRWHAADLLVRDLDLALWCFGKMPDALYRVANASCTQIHLGFPGGGMALIDQARTGGSYYSLSLIGSSGAAYADDQANAQLASQASGTRAIRSDDSTAQWTAIVQGFVDALRHEGAAFADWESVFALRDALAKPQAGAT